MRVWILLGLLTACGGSDAEDSGNSDLPNDTAVNDTAVDTGTGDTGSVDTGSGDTGSVDTGSGDTGSVDTGSGAVDSDGDGVTTADGDCDDENDTVYPEAEELCDDIDNDCDGEEDEGAAMDTEWTVSEYLDVSGYSMGIDMAPYLNCNIETYTASYQAYPGDPDDPTDGIMNPGLTFSITGRCFENFMDGRFEVVVEGENLTGSSVSGTATFNYRDGDWSTSPDDTVINTWTGTLREPDCDTPGYLSVVLEDAGFTGVGFWTTATMSGAFELSQ